MSDDKTILYRNFFAFQVPWKACTDIPIYQRAVAGKLFSEIKFLWVI